MRSGQGGGAGVALITGASGGIGSALAAGLGREGTAVAVHYASRKAEAQALAAAITRDGGRAATFRADLREPGEIAALVANVEAMLGAPSCLVHAATPAIRPAPPLLATDDDLLEHLSVQSVAMARLCRAALPAMQRRQSGVVIGLLSTVLEHPRPKRWGAYTAGKFALAGVLSGLATDVEGSGVRVIGLMPSAVDTDLLRAANEGEGLGELLRPEAVAAAALRIVAEPSRFPNGSLVRLRPGSTEVGRLAFAGRSLGEVGGG